MTTFKDLGLNPEIMESLDDLGFTEPSPIQEKAIPFLLQSKKDLTALAQTGTGKTAAYSLPILNQIKAGERDLQAIILCPTRELCLQIFQDIKKFSKHSKGIEVTAVYGGERIDLQIRILKKGVNIVVGTPGRVHDLIRRNVLKLQSIKWLVLDEADEMLDMGFKEDLDIILKETPKTRQTLLFSATMSRSVQSIANQYMTGAEEISVGTKNSGADNVSHEYYVVGARDRFDALRRILDSLPGVYGILFCRTRNETQVVADKLKEANYSAEALHGEVSQNMRTKIMDRFKKKQIRLLVATDVAARGIDVNNLSHVINYNLPDQNEAYTHRSGRTGRAQNNGVAITIASPSEARRVRSLESVVGKEIILKKIPSGIDVCKKQINSFIEEIETVNIDELGNEEYLVEVTDKLKKVKKEDLIKLFLTHKFKHLTDLYKNACDLNAEVKNYNDKKGYAGGIGIKINFGKKDGFDIKGLFGLINSNKNLKGIEIGRINLMSDYSVFSVDKKDADRVVNYLKGTSFRGQKIFVSKTAMESGYQGGGRSGGAYQGKRKSGFGGGYQGKNKRPGRSRY